MPLNLMPYSTSSSSEEDLDFVPPPNPPNRSLRQRELTDKYKESMEYINEELKLDPASE